MTGSQASDSNEDARVAKRDNYSGARRGRPAADRSATHDRENSDAIRRAERRAMLNDINTLLPNPPKIPGFHLFWATTTNQKDPIEFRQRLGYTFVTPEEVPDFRLDQSQKAGEATSDRIMVNEMVLMKIREDDFVGDMLDKHHYQPKEMIENLSNSVRMDRDGKGRQVAFTGGDFRDGKAEGYHGLNSTLRTNQNMLSLEGIL